MDGYARQASGACEHVDADGPDDAAPAPADTGTPGMVPRGDCVASTETPENSLEALGRTDTDSGLGPSSLLIELLDGALDGDRFWAVGQGGLMSFDLSGDAPELDDVHSGLSGRFYRLLLVGGDEPLVYATHRDEGLVVIDRSDPSDLDEIHNLRMNGLGGLSLLDNRVYASKHDGSIAVFDVTDPSSPSLLSTAEGEGHPWTVVASPEALYTADNTHGLGVFNLNDPDNPMAEGHIDVGSGLLDLAMSNDTLFLAAGSGGMIVMDLENPLAPEPVARLETGSPIVDISVANSIAWLVDHESVWAVDVTDRDNPTVIGRHRTPRFAMAVAADGFDAWVGDWTAVGGYRAHPDRAKSALVARPDALQMPAGTDAASFRIRNLGSAAGSVLAWDSSEAELELEIPSDSLVPGAQQSVVFDWPSTAGNGTVCLRTDDPSVPTIEVTIQRSDSSLSIPLGSAAPDFELTTLDGESLRLSEQLGHPVLLVYFATW